jgi:benzoylformate decarboxylase
MTGYTGADLFVDTLQEYGVTHIFGNPGTTELPVMEALSGTELEYVLGLHEDIAVGAAAGYAQARRYHASQDESVVPVGVVNLHITPGLAHGLGNIYNADFSGVPMVVTAGNHELDFRHEEPLLDGDLQAMVSQFCKESAEVTSVDVLPMLLRRAFRVALTPPTGPVFLALPVDVMMSETAAVPERLGPIPEIGAGDSNQISQAADYLVAADEPVLILGDHVARAGADAVEAAVELAEATGARVHGEILAGEANFPTEHDQWISFVGASEGIASMLLNTDTLCLVGCSTNTTLLRHESPIVDEETTVIQSSSDPHEVGKLHPADAAIIGDPGFVMRAITSEVSARLDETTRQARLDAVANTKAGLAGTMKSLGEDETPEGSTRASKAELVDVMVDVAPDAFIIDEGVTSKFALLTRFPFAAQQYISNKGGGLGYSLPASIGAALAEREHAAGGGDPREVVCYIGDGSYLYYPHSVYTAVRNELDLTVVVSDNRNYRILKNNTTAMLGETEDQRDYVGMDFEPAVDIAANAESHGANGHLVEKPSEISDVLSEAIGNGEVDVLDVLVHD